MEVRVYQINANRDFMGFAFAPLSKQTSNDRKTVQAQFYDCVFEGHISFEDVHFSYETSDEVLKGISFEVKKGSKIYLYK